MEGGLSKRRRICLRELRPNAKVSVIGAGRVQRMSKMDDVAREGDACANGSGLTLAVALPAEVQRRISVFRLRLQRPFCLEVLVHKKN